MKASLGEPAAGEAWGGGLSVACLVCLMDEMAVGLLMRLGGGDVGGMLGGGRLGKSDL